MIRKRIRKKLNRINNKYKYLYPECISFYQNLNHRIMFSPNRQSLDSVLWTRVIVDLIMQHGHGHPQPAHLQMGVLEIIVYILQTVVKCPLLTSMYEEWVFQ